MFDVRGRVALVTGGARGFGLAVSRRLLEEGAAGLAVADLDDGDGGAAALAGDFGGDRVLFVRLGC